MPRWLQAARQATEPDSQSAHETRPGAAVTPARGVLSVKSVLSEAGSPSLAPRVATPLRSKPETLPPARADGLDPDAGAYLDRLRLNGPATYGAIATATGWGATRAWQAEAKLRALGLVVYREGKTEAKPS